jgi:hypothetical protein
MYVFIYFLSCVSVCTVVYAAPTGPECNKGKSQNPIVYTAWARSSKQLNPRYGDDAPPTQGLDQPLRQNGTWIDVGVWVERQDIVSQEPFLFTLGPGRDKTTYTIIPWKDGKSLPDKKLAYSEGDSSISVNYGSLSAFILTDQGNSKTQLVDDWTVSKDDQGRLVLGLQKLNDADGLKPKGEGRWTMGGCAWTKEDTKACDGFYFTSCSACYGTASVIELMEHKQRS